MQRSRAQLLAGLLVVWSVAWSVRPGLISEDTKNDLYVDPWGFLGRALHLWDPQVTWGGLQNQAFGYLFPMGPFFGLGSELLPMWVVQRLWWMALLTIGLVSMVGLLRSLGIGGPGTRVVAALAYVLAPRVLSTIGGLSSEAQPQLLAPAILWPLVLVDRGRLGARKGAALSATAVLFCGGVNATATAFAAIPAALWLLTRHQWWRQPVTWLWGLLVLGATSWWLVPLLFLGRYSPPFLDWIENARTVTAQISLLDVLRGTTHWLGHLVTSAGEWWPAGYQLVAAPTSILATAAVMVLGLAGLALRQLPERTFAVLCLGLGVLVIALPHQGPFASPVDDVVRAALDGPLAPLRNVHKADPLIRLPLVLGLAHLLSRVARARTRPAWLGPAGFTAAALVVIAAAAPGFSGAIAPRGAFPEMAAHWREAGRWLDEQGNGQAVIVPASGFGEYLWGRPMDEPLRSLTSTGYAVRDAVPLAPAGTIRLLDEVETRLQTGRSLGGAVSMLRSAGVRYLVVRNDLAADAAGQPPVAITRSAVLNTPGVTFAKGFGKTMLDGTGERVHPVEVYAIAGPVASELEAWDARDVIGAAGAAEDLARLADAGLGQRPVVFDGDRRPGLTPTEEVVTDGFRARDRWFGAPRGQDVSSSLTARRAAAASDYFPWPDVARRSTVAHEGIKDVSASTSIADDFGVTGLQPAHRPFAALDGDPGTAWVTALDPDPRLTITLPEPTNLARLELLPYANRVRFGGGLGIATKVTVTTDRGSVDAELGPTGGPTTVELPAGDTTTVSIRIRATTGGAPGEVVTGLAEVSLPGVAAVEVIRTPEPASPANTALLGSALPGRDGCALLERRFTCFSGLLVDPESTGPLVRDVRGLAPGERRLTGTLVVNPLDPPQELLTVPGVEVTTSSLRGYGVEGQPVATVDSDPRTAWSPSPDDSSPSVTVTLAQPTKVEALRLQTRGDWARKEAPAVLVDIDGHEVTRRLPEDGVLRIPATTGRRITLTFVSVPGKSRPGMGALELEEFEVLGQRFPAPAQELRSACGQGPPLTIGGTTVPTAASGPRSALFGLGEFTWSACRPVHLTDADPTRVTIGTWRGLAPRSVDIAPTRPTPNATGVAVSHDRESPTRLSARLEPGDERLLVMGDNANVGWAATLEGKPLEPQVVDGRRQGFVVPAGAQGAVSIEFTPDRPFRVGLAVGAFLAGAVLLLALWPDRGQRRVRTRPAQIPGLLLEAGVVGWSGLIAGPVGSAVALAAVAVRRLARGRGSVVWAVGVVALGLGAAAVQAWLAPGSVGSSAVEGGVRLGVLAAFALALVSQEPTDRR